jgi:hypothetical protein
MGLELKMNAANSGYSIVSLVFFISYVIFQAPATIVVRKIGPHRFLSFIVLAWGLVMMVRLQTNTSRGLFSLLAPCRGLVLWKTGRPWPFSERFLVPSKEDFIQAAYTFLAPGIPAMSSRSAMPLSSSSETLPRLLVVS